MSGKGATLVHYLKSSIRPLVRWQRGTGMPIDEEHRQIDAPQFDANDQNNTSGSVTNDIESNINISLANGSTPKLRESEVSANRTRQEHLTQQTTEMHLNTNGICLSPCNPLRVLLPIGEKRIFSSFYEPYVLPLYRDTNYAQYDRCTNISKASMVVTRQPILTTPINSGVLTTPMQSVTQSDMLSQSLPSNTPVVIQSTCEGEISYEGRSMDEPIQLPTFSRPQNLSRANSSTRSSCDRANIGTTEVHRQQQHQPKEQLCRQIESQQSQQRHVSRQVKLSKAHQHAQEQHSIDQQQWQPQQALQISLRDAQEQKPKQNDDLQLQQLQQYHMGHEHTTHGQVQQHVQRQRTSSQKQQHKIPHQQLLPQVLQEREELATYNTVHINNAQKPLHNGNHWKGVLDHASFETPKHRMKGNKSASNDSVCEKLSRAKRNKKLALLNAETPATSTTATTAASSTRVLTKIRPQQRDSQPCPLCSGKVEYIARSSLGAICAQHTACIKQLKKVNHLGKNDMLKVVLRSTGKVSQKRSENKTLGIPIDFFSLSGHVFGSV